MGRNNDTTELNLLLIKEGFKGDIPLEIEEDNTDSLEFCEIDENWELEANFG